MRHVAHPDRGAVDHLDRQVVELLDRRRRVVEADVVLVIADLGEADRVDLRLVGQRRRDVLRREAARLQRIGIDVDLDLALLRSEEHTSELQSLMRISYAVFCLKKKKYIKIYH